MTHEELLAYLHMVGCELSSNTAMYFGESDPRLRSTFSAYWSMGRDKYPYVVYANFGRTETSSPDEVYNIARQAIAQYLQEKP